MENIKIIGNNIKRLREQYKLSQEVVSSYLDIDQSFLSKIEKGERNISISLIDKICALFCIDSEDLYNEDINNTGYVVAFRAKDIDKKGLEGISMVNKIVQNDLLLKELSERKNKHD